MRLDLTLYKVFIIQKNKLYNEKTLARRHRTPGPKARRVAAGRHIAGERALSRAQMVQHSPVSKFFDIMEKVLLEQG